MIAAGALRCSALVVRRICMPWQCIFYSVRLASFLNSLKHDVHLDAVQFAIHRYSLLAGVFIITPRVVSGHKLASHCFLAFHLLYCKDSGGSRICIPWIDLLYLFADDLFCSDAESILAHIIVNRQWSLIRPPTMLVVLDPTLSTLIASLC